MKYIKMAFCSLTAVILCIFTVSCQNSSNVYNKADYYTKDGKITVSARFAYYNNGTVIPGLAEFDDEKGNEKVPDDGGFVVYFAVSNKSNFDKKITEIGVEYIKNSDNYDIVEPAVFDMTDDVYIAAGEVRFIECVFEKEQVLMQIKLNDLNTKTSVKYEGCVIKGKEPKSTENSLTASVKEAKFTSTNGLEGSFYIKNNFNDKAKLGSISFMLYTDKGYKITEKPVKMQVNTDIESGEFITLKFAVLPGNISNSIKENKRFDNIEIKLSQE